MISDRTDGVGCDASSTVKLNQSESYARTHEADAFEALALRILSEEIPGEPTLPATRHGARHLAQRLREGWPERDARALVRAMPAIAEAKPSARRFLSPEAFEGRIFSGWLGDFAEWSARQRAAGEAAQVELFRREQQLRLAVDLDEPPADRLERLAAIAGEFGGDT